MKKLIYLFVILLFASCNSGTFKSTAGHPEFKTSQNAFENVLKQDIDFTHLGVGVYMSNKNKELKEKGINLTFQTDKLNQLKDSTLLVYSDIIVKNLKKDLLHLDDYDVAIIKFQNKITNGDIIKSNSVQINKTLK